VVVHYVEYCYHYCWNYLYNYDYGCGCYYYPFSTTPYYWDGGYGMYYYWGDDCGCYYYDDGSYYYSYWDYDCGCNYYWYSVEKEYYYWDDYCGCHNWSKKPPSDKTSDKKPDYCKYETFVYDPKCDNWKKDKSNSASKQSESASKQSESDKNLVAQTTSTTKS
jgi:hypothetical protein